MPRTFNDVLLDLLTIVKYPSNKQKFIKEFEELNHGEAVANMLEKLPGEIQDKIKASENKVEEIKKHLPVDEYRTEVEKVSAQALVNFINVISPLLTLRQKEKVTALMHN